MKVVNGTRSVESRDGGENFEHFNAIISVAGRADELRRCLHWWGLLLVLLVELSFKMIVTVA